MPTDLTHDEVVNNTNDKPARAQYLGDRVKVAKDGKDNDKANDWY